MNTHRKSLLGVVALAIIGFIVARVIFPIGDVEIQSYWTTTGRPYLSAHASNWVLAGSDWLGPFWVGVVSTIFVIFTIDALILLMHYTRAPAYAVINVERTRLRLRFSGELEAPHAIDDENVESWFAYWSPTAQMSDQMGRPLLVVPSTWAVFIVFNKPVFYHQLTVGFIGGRPPSYEVKQARDRSALITITGPLPPCEMEVLTRQK